MDLKFVGIEKVRRKGSWAGILGRKVLEALMGTNFFGDWSDWLVPKRTTNGHECGWVEGCGWGVFSRKERRKHKEEAGGVGWTLECGEILCGG